MIKTNIGFFEALDLVLANCRPGSWEEVALFGLTGRVLAEEVLALVDSPSLDVSLKDGYALYAREAASARPDNPVVLKLADFHAAGDRPGGTLQPGTCVRVTTGAPLPPGADAVLAGEFAREENGLVRCFNDAGPGRNVLFKGTDVRAGQVIAAQGEMLHPALIGLLAAAGLDRVKVVTQPKVAVIGTGDEVVAPGRPLPPGKLYASNMVETVSWLKTFGLTEVISRVVPDRVEAIAAAIKETAGLVQAFITSGGAWKSERDYMIRVLEDLGWQGVFSRVRLGPGKAISFGLLEDRPFFILPGGPPSHEAAFLLLALPGLLAMSGRSGPIFPRLRASLTDTISGQVDWTQCIQVKLFEQDKRWMAQPLKSASRLSSMARKDGLVILPEGVTERPAGAEVEVLCLNWPFFPGESA